ncbi:MAG TPA: gamma-glutamyl-gamma-aminobutyrate hydrolase family protein, partial [Acidimicrobiales bacterium]|nr:gamma-glutamyl-gamma-aminobutyrate hydrolase family protein [Acidimicrobiales bacterium]
ALCRGALERELPLLAICRGLQVLNVSMGGTLHQHLPDVVGGDAHRSAPGQMTANRVTLNTGSAVGSILGSILGAETEGSCHHHQAIDRLGRGVQAVGFAGDGTVEAIEVQGNDFAIGVQWHPEDDQDDDRLFVALVEAASRYRDARAARPVPAAPEPGRP